MRSSVVDDVEDDDILLFTLHTNDFFGEIALLNDSPRTATISCATNCMLLVLSAADFKRFLSIAPEIKNALNQCVV